MDCEQHEWFSHETGQSYALPPIFVFVFGFVVAIPMVWLWLPETSPVTVCDVLHGRCSRVAAAQYHAIMPGSLRRYMFVS